MRVNKTLPEWLRESLRSGLLFGRADEPLDAYGKRIVRVILDELESVLGGSAASPEVRTTKEQEHAEQVIGCPNCLPWELCHACKAKQAGAPKPKVICLCGSTRFIEQFATATWELERGEGAIVLGCTLLPMWYCGVQSHFGEATGTKEQCDEHHRRKIDLADEILVLNIGGYIGESTRGEIEYAHATGKPVRYVMDEPALLLKILPPTVLGAADQPPSVEGEP